MAIVKLLCRHPGGTFTLQIDNSLSNKEFRNILSERTSIEPSYQNRYPPQVLYLDDEKAIGEYVSSGDTLTVSKLENPHVQKQKPSFSSLHRIPKRIEVPDDNSCLFNAVSYCFENHTFDMSTVLREITSSIILSNPELYNEAMLGKGNQEYSEWISKPTSWGGAIEISVLSNYYEAEIFVFEVANNMKNCFGEGQGYNKRIYLIYDGIHYDALAMVDQKHNIATIFDSTDSSATEVFESLTMKEKSLGKYTDTAKFTLLCNDCKQTFVGEKGATEHAKLTGHTNFVENR